MAEDNSIEGFAARRRRQREEEEAQGTQISFEVRPRPELVEDGNVFLVASLKLKGELPIKQDLNDGDLLTVQVADADGNVIASGLYEVGLPGFKPIKAKGAGVIGTERVHNASFNPEA